MTWLDADILATGIVTALACGLGGVFLVLRRMSLISDAISHAILLGIVVAFFAVRDLGSPWLLIGATLTGVLTVTLIQLLTRTGRVKDDAAIGLVFPVLFSIGVILISRYAANIHLDTDAVLYGEIGLTPFTRFIALGYDWGPRAMVQMTGVLALNLAFILAFYKELKLSTFDAGLAAVLGFMPMLLHYALITLVSLTAVAAFDAVGSILVVALMVAPAAAAYLLTDRLPVMLLLTGLNGVVAAAGGYALARWLDASIAGMMAAVCGAAFVLALLLAPQRGLLPQWISKRRQRWAFAGQLLAVHLLNHQGTAAEALECTVPHCREHMRWAEEFARGVVARAVHRGLVSRTGEALHLTQRGAEVAREVMQRT